MQKEIANNDFSTQASEWFDNMVSNLTFDKHFHKLDILDPEKKQVYNDMIKGNDFGIHAYAKNKSSEFFIMNLLNEYINELLITYNSSPKKIGLELSDSKILVWAEIKNDDENSEDGLILSQAKVNAKYEQYGFYISSTIVEERDNLTIPNHYTELAIPNQ